MKKNCTEVVFVLDRSGSMCGLEKDTIGGFNSLNRRNKTEKFQFRPSYLMIQVWSFMIVNRLMKLDL